MRETDNGFAPSHHFTRAGDMMGEQWDAKGTIGGGRPIDVSGDAIGAKPSPAPAGDGGSKGIDSKHRLSGPGPKVPREYAIREGHRDVRGGFDGWRDVLSGAVGLIREGWWDIRRRYIPIVRAALVAALFIPALGACATIEQLVGQYGGEEGLGLLVKAADGIDTIEDATLGNAAKVLPKYCLVPAPARTLLRTRFNARAEAEGAMLGVYCPGDEVLTLGAVE